jgi:hypothetical protein
MKFMDKATHSSVIILRGGADARRLPSVTSQNGAVGSCLSAVATQVVCKQLLYIGLLSLGCKLQFMFRNYRCRYVNFRGAVVAQSM